MFKRATFTLSGEGHFEFPTNTKDNFVGNNKSQASSQLGGGGGGLRVMVYTATFNNISIISWQSVLSLSL